MSKNNHVDMKFMVDRGFVEVAPGIWERPKNQAVKASKPIKEKKHKYNAKKVTEEGVVYDSKRELKFKHMLDQNGIKYRMKVKYVLQEKIRYQGEVIREIYMLPDFTIMKGEMSCAILDIKGMITSGYLLKEKMLKKKLFDMGHEIPIFTPRNNKEMDIAIRELQILTKDGG
jgi:hypothetical protein